MYDLILTDDPANWPPSAFFHLPTLPLSLILSRFDLNGNNYVPVVPVLLNLTAASRFNLFTLPQTSGIINPIQISHPSSSHSPHWPPSPLIFSFFLYPLTRFLYRRMHARLTRFVMGSDTGRRIGGADRAQGQEGGELEEGEGQLMIQFRALIANDDPPPANAAQAPGAGQDAAPAAPAAQAQDAPVAGAEDREVVGRTSISLSNLSLRISGALLIPFISNRMGMLLLRASRHSGLLQKVLGVDHRPYSRGGYGRYGAGSAFGWGGPTVRGTQGVGISGAMGGRGGFWAFVTALGRRWDVDGLDPVWLVLSLPGAALMQAVRNT